MRGAVRAAAALCAAAALVLPASPAPAHEGGVPTVPVLEAVRPAVRGLSVRVRTSIAPLIEITNETGRAVTVLGLDGEPFLRLDAGRIELNDRSPTAFRSADPFGYRRLPERADASAEPVWIERGPGATWRWFDPRLRGPASSAWTVPMRVGDDAVSVSGRTEALNEHGHLRTVLDGVSPATPKLTVRVLEGLIPALFVNNATGRELVVPGQRDEPFLRIGPDGVFANTLSPTYHLAGRTTPQAEPGSADAQAEPRWTKVSPSPAWAWLEYRARIPGDEQPYDLGPRRREVLRWTTPMRLGGEPVSVRGRVEWVPAGQAAEPPRAGWAGAAGVAAVLAFSVALWTAGRRRGIPPSAL